MSETIGTAYIQIEPSAEGISGSISKILEPEATKVGKNAGSKLSGALGTAAKASIVGVTALAGAAVSAGVALTNSASATAQYGDEIDKMSQKMGVSSTFYQEWDAVLQHSGTSMSAMKTSFKTLSNAVQDGSEDQQKAFAALGLSMEDLQNMSTEEVFQSVVAGLQGMEEGTERTALATDLLGKGAIEMGALFNTSAEDTQAMIDTVHELGGVMSDDAVKSAAAFQDSLQDMQTSFSGLKNSAMSELLPSFTSVMDGISALVTGQDDAETKLTQGFQDLIGNITRALPSLISGLSTALSAIAEVAPDLLSALADGIITALPELIPTLIELINDITNKLIELLPQLLEVGLQLLLELATGISQALPELIPAIVDVMVTMQTYLLDNIDLLVDAAVLLVGGLVKGLIAAAPKMLEAGKNLLQRVIDGWKSLFSAMYVAVFKLVTDIKDKFIAKKNTMIEAGKNLVSAIKDGLVAAWQKVVEWFEEKLKWIKDKFTSAFSIEAPSWLGGNSSKSVGSTAKTVESYRYSPNTLSSAITTPYNPAGASSNSIQVKVKLEGDAERLFRVMQIEARRNEELVGV